MVSNGLFTLACHAKDVLFSDLTTLRIKASPKTPVRRDHKVPELHDDAPKRATRRYRRDRNNGLGFSPGTLARGGKPQRCPQEGHDTHMHCRRRRL